MVATAVVIVVAMVARLARPPVLRPIVASPPGRALSVRVGDSVAFSATADGAIRFKWLRWGREVARGGGWSFVPGPEDVGWQQVTVVAIGRRGVRRTRTWDVGVVQAVAPEVVEVVPPAGRVTLTTGSPATFRCRARVRAARPADQLRFDWAIDDRPLRRDQRPAAGAASELVLPATESGRHRVTVRVTEDDRIAIVTQWIVEGTASAPPPQPRAGRVIRVPEAPEVLVLLGESLALAAEVEPTRAGVAYSWALDGRIAQEGAIPRFDYFATRAGPHRVTVSAMKDGTRIGTGSWSITVREARAAAPAAEPAPSAMAAPGSHTQTVTAPPAAVGLLEDEVRRWLEDYAQAWSRKDVDALRRMGQVRDQGESERLQRYFRSIDDLRVDVRVLALRVDGNRASVEFERTDTMTDPAGQRRELRLPPFHKEIERTPEGLRFTPGDSHG